MSHPYWVEVEIKGEVEVSWVKGQVEVSGLWFVDIFRSTQIVEQHLFFMFPSILTFNFDLI